MIDDEVPAEGKKIKIGSVKLLFLFNLKHSTLIMKNNMGCLSFRDSIIIEQLSLSFKSKYKQKQTTINCKQNHHFNSPVLLINKLRMLIMNHLSGETGVRV